MRGSKADEAIDKAARGVMLWPERRVAIGDIDGVESKAVLDALESTTLSSVGAARDLKIHKVSQSAVKKPHGEWTKTVTLQKETWIHGT